MFRHEFQWYCCIIPRSVHGNHRKTSRNESRTRRHTASAWSDHHHLHPYGRLSSIEEQHRFNHAADRAKGFDMSRTTVVHCRKEYYEVYIGRPSVWGNPFKIGRDGDRAQVIEKYRSWIATQPELIELLPSLKGKILGCWRKPQYCHGDVLAELVDAYKTESRTLI